MGILILLLLTGASIATPHAPSIATDKGDIIFVLNTTSVRAAQFPLSVNLSLA
jgi:hypothetical protein